MDHGNFKIKEKGEREGKMRMIIPYFLQYGSWDTKINEQINTQRKLFFPLGI